MARYKVTIVFEVHEDPAGDLDKCSDTGTLMQTKLLDDLDNAFGVDVFNIDSPYPVTYEIVSCDKLKEE
jgi:hypothetical protein